MFTAFQWTRRWCKDWRFVPQLQSVSSCFRVCQTGGALTRCYRGLLRDFGAWKVVITVHLLPVLLPKLICCFCYCKINCNILLLFPLERQQSCCIVYRKAETAWTSRSSSRELVSISAKNEVNLLYTCHQHWDLTI